MYPATVMYLSTDLSERRSGRPQACFRSFRKYRVSGMWKGIQMKPSMLRYQWIWVLMPIHGTVYRQHLSYSYSINRYLTRTMRAKWMKLPKSIQGKHKIPGWRSSLVRQYFSPLKILAILEEAFPATLKTNPVTKMRSGAKYSTGFSSSVWRREIWEDIGKRVTGSSSWRLDEHNRTPGSCHW